MQKFFLQTTLLFISIFGASAVFSQCYSGGPSYCTNISASNVASYGMGMQNITLNTSAIPVQINNTTTAGSGTPIYFDYTSQVLNAPSGGTVNYSIKGPSGNNSNIRLFIDYNNDGTFNTSGSELVLDLLNVTTAGGGQVVTGTFVLPTLSAGVYRIRVASDFQGAPVPAPCGPLQYSAEIEDYTLIVPSGSMDVSSSGIPNPGFFLTGNNTVAVRFVNLSNTTITTADIGYQLGAGAPVTESLTGLSIASGQTYIATFTTPLNIPSTGNYSMKAWANNANGSGSVTPANDTVCRSFTVYCSAPLNGNYTIGGTPGPTNFANFNLADSNLITCGVAGPVIFKVSPGTYTGAIDLPAITGASATNTITFEGASSSNTIITATTSGAAPAVVRLNGCSYVTFRNFTIRTTDGTNGWAVHFFNGLNNRVNNCILDIAGPGATATGSNLAGVVINGSYTSITGSNSTGNGHIVDSSTFNAGYYNIYTTAGSAVTYSFLYNTLNNAYQYGGYFNSSHTIKFNYNTVNLRPTFTGNYCLRYFNCNAPGTHEINNNRFIGIGTYGIQLQTSGGGSGSGQIYNNFFSGFRNTTSCYGIQNGSSSSWKVWHNNINIDVNATSGTSTCIGLSSGSGFDIRNNHLSITANPCVGAVPMSFTSTSCASTVDYNNYFNAANTSLSAIPTVLTAGTYLAAYPTGIGANSMNTNPGYVNNSTNLHVTNPCLNGTNLGLTTDIDSQARSSTPDIGADEIPSFSLDAMVMAIRSPATAIVTPGSPYTVTITVRNAGTTTITDLDANYSVNGSVTSQSFSGLNILPCDTLQLSFSSTYTFSGGNNVFRAFTGNVNTSPDQNNINDTLTTNFCTPFSGVFTINKTLPQSQSNFTSVQSAINAVYSCGINGPVTLRIASGSGPYNEQVLFNGIVPGSNFINTVRLSGNTTREAITFLPTNSSAQYVIRLQATKCIILDSLTINNTGTSFGTGVHITSLSDSNFVQNSIINISLASTSFSNSAGIAISTIAANVTGAGNNGNTNTINNNTINGGYFGITAIGTNTTTFCLRNIITNNILNGQAYYGLYHFYQNFTKVNGNTIDNMLSANTNAYAMRFENVDNFEINKNKINRFGQYGMYFNGANHQGGSGTNRSQIINNMIGGIAYNANPYGVYFQIGGAPSTFRYVDFWHNTIHLNNAGGNTGSIFFFQNFSASTSIVSLDFRNNTFTANGNTTTYFYAYNGGYGAPFTSFLNNNIYSISNPGGSSVTMNTTSSSGNSWISASFGGVNTISCKGLDPVFLNTSTNLHTLSTPLSNVGINTTVTSDIDGDVRPLAPSGTVDIGADEFNIPAENIGVFAVLNPALPLTPGLQNVVVQIKNYGTATITSANVRYKVGVNGSIYTFPWTGTITTGSTANVTFTGANQYNFTGTKDSIFAWTDGPNGLPDGYAANDSAMSIICAPLNGNYTIDSSMATGGSNFRSFNDAIGSLNSCGITGPVRFTVAAGTYNGSLDITSIFGSSAVNTVTFDGVNSATRIITAITSAAAPAVLRFNACNFVTFRNVTVRTTDASNGWAAHFFNGTNNRVTNSILEIGGAGATSANSNLAPVVMNGSLTSMGTSSTIGNNHRVDSSTLNAGYYSVYTANSSNTNVLYFLNNTMNNAYYYGASLNNGHVIKFNNNIVNMRGINTATYGLYIWICSASGVLFHEIKGNNFTNIGQYGIYMQSSTGSGSSFGQIYNNMISGFKYTFGNTGIYLTSSSRWNIWHNSINLDFASSGGTSNCMYIQNGSTNDIRNNIMSITSPTIVGAVPFNITPNSAVTALNNNIYFNASSLNLITGSINSNTSNYQLNFPLGGGSGSMNVNPRFVNNATDLHTLNGCNYGTNLGLTSDFDNQARGTTPDIGADETSPSLNNDMGVLKLNTPSFPLVAGSTNVNVTLKNYGLNTINSVTVSYMVNGGSLTTQTLTGLSLAACDTMNFTFTTPYTVTGPSSFSIFTSNPNGVTDTYFANDTANLSLCIALSGAYTIGGGGSYTTFAAAVAALNCGGVSGPVVFNVLSGTYTEQFAIGNVQGTSATNTITFDGGAGNASSRIVTFGGSAANPHTFRMNGSQFINVRNLTIRSTDANNGWPLNIIDGQNISVSNCNIEIGGTGATSTSSNLGAVVLNGSTTSISASSGANANIYIDSNYIRGGYYGIQSYGTSNTTTYANILYMRYNRIDSAYQYGVQFYFNTVKILSNFINMRFNGSSTSAGVFCQQQTNSSYPLFCDISGNTVFNAGQFGMRLENFYNPYGGGIPYHRVSNNMIGKFRTTGTAQTFGLYFSSSYYVAVYHNTINVDNATTGTTLTVSPAGNRALYFSQISSNDSVANNIFAIGNASATNAIPVQFGSTTTVVNVNNNYYNANNTNLIRIGSTNYLAASVATAWPSGGGTGSKNINPQFPSSTDLHIGAAVAATALNVNLGSTISACPYDIDNQPRNPIQGTTTPDMGADEKTTTNVGISTVVSPATVTAGGTYSITVRIRNYGSDAVSNIPVRYNLNGGTTVLETYAPTLNGNDSVNYTFTTTATFAGCNALKTWTALAGESYLPNDSTNVNIGGSIIGTYTVKPGGGGNFTTLAAAVASLTCGIVTGPVTFLVDPFTYNEQITIPSTIVGVSATNTITFDGGNGNAASVILTFATGSSASGLSHVLRFNNCNFVTFRNMTIRSSGASEAWTVHFMNGTNNRLNNCIVDMAGTGTTSTSSNYTAVVINGSTTSFGTSSVTANNHRIDSSTINFGYYGLYSAVNNGNLVNYFINNTWNNAYQYGVIFQNPQTVKFNNNTINTRSTMTTAYGIQLSSVNPLGANFNEVNGNRILRTGQYGIYFVSTTGGPINQGQCYNNSINGMTYTNSTVGIFVNSASNWNLYHNTVNHDIISTGGSSYGIQVQNGSNNDVRNNMLSTTMPTTVGWTPLWISPSSAVSAVNGNNYWNPSSSNLVNIAGVNYTPANFKANYPSGGGLTSLNNNPSYVSAFNVHVTNPCNNGVNLGVTSDVDGNSRGTTPDIGSDEMNTVPNNDFGVSIINSPNFPLASGSQSINVTLKNYGGNTITAADINYRVNGGAVTTQAWTGSLAPCDTISLTLTTPYTFGSGASNLKVFTTNPNGVSDATLSNDTAQWTLCPAMAGTYTIGGGGNYATFNAALNDLYCAGVSGHVTFVVANGTYTEQVSILPINGASSTKRIRFTSASGNPALTTLTFTPVSAGSYTLQFNGADYITFDRMTIANGYTASTVYTTWLANGADFDSISNCIIANPTNNNAFGIYQNNTTDRNFTMFNDSIKGGGYGIFMQSNTSVPSTNHAYVNNVIINQTNNYAIYSYYQDSVLISGNTITTNAPPSIYYGIYTQLNGKFPRITKNKIVGINASSTCYGMQHNNFANNGFSFGRGLIANNFIQLGGTASTNHGIMFQSGSNYTDIMHNTINMTTTVLSPNVSCFYYQTSLTGNTVQNNIFQASGNGITSCAVANIGTSGTSGCVFNNNNFFSRNATTFGYCGTSNGTSQTSYNNFKTGGAAISSFESVGLNREVSFVSTTDLHTTTPCIANAGANVLSIVPDDIDNTARTSTPDIGADEFTTNAFDASVIYVRSPANAVVTPGSPYTIVITVRNNGSAAITTLDANYSVNNGAATSQTFTVGAGLPVGGIQACDTLQLTFTVPFTFGAGGNNVFRAFTGNVNTNADLVNSNDTLVANFCTPFSGVFTINKNLPQTQTNFTSVQSAVNAVYSCGVVGPVTLRIEAGSGPYNEQVLFSGIVPGSSATNTVRLTGNTTRETITWLPIASNQQHTIRLQSAKHILLDSLTINNTGASFGIGVHITATSDSNYVQNSNVNISLVSTGFSNSAGIAIASNAASATGTGNNGNKNVISNNAIVGGYYGLTAFGTNTTTFCQNNQFLNNTFNGQAYYGMYLSFQNLVSINENIVDNILSTNVSSMGMRFEYVERFEIKKNKINRAGNYGMYFNFANYQLGSGIDKSEISNNMIGGIFYSTNPYGINITSGGCRNINFFHNSISVMNAGFGYAFQMQYSTSGNYGGLVFKNNSFVVYNGSQYAGYFYWQTSGMTPAQPIDSFKNNNIWNSNTGATQAVFGQNGYNTNGWISPSTNGLNTSTCLWVDPLYINPSTNLHTISGALSNNGTNIPTITTDIDGDTRPLSPSSTVDIGADEFNVPAENIGAFAVISPTLPLVTGLQDVIVQIKNFGSATITSANVRYKVGAGGTTRTIAWTGSIATNATANVTFTGVNQYNFTGSYDTVIAWTDAPNGLPDGYLANDTTSSMVCQSLNGVYTMDTTLPASATNFVNFNSIATKLNNCGVSGPVTINIANGTYSEQFTLNQIYGASATNTVTFQSASGIAANVVIQFNGGSSAANNFVVKMNGADNTIWRNLTLQSTNTSFSTLVWQLNNTRFNTYRNVIFNGPTVFTTSSNNSLVFANSTTLVNAGQGDDNNTFDSCAFNNGSFGIYSNVSYSSVYTYNCAFTNNTFNNQYYMGMNLVYHLSMNIYNNTITSNSAYSNYYGINYASNTGIYHSGKISRNRISAPNANGFGIYCYYLNGPNCIVLNNMINIGTGSGSASYGMYMGYSNCRIHHNTVNITSGNANSFAAYIYNNAYSGPSSDIRYNIFANSGNGSTSGYCIYSVSNSTSFTTIDSNVYYQGTGAGNFGNFNGTAYATFAAWKAAMGAPYDPGSIVANPNFFSQTNPRINSVANIRSVPRQSYMTEDIDGARCGVVTETGADDHPAANDIGVSSISNPLNGVASPGLTTISVYLRNYGSNAVTSANVTYDISGTVVTQAWTGTLNPCDSVLFSFSTQYNFSGGFTMKAFTTSPNGSSDAIPANDTVIVGGCLGMSGLYTIDTAGSGPTNFLSFNAALTAMAGCGISGPVVFDVKAATYNEQVVIPFINGTTAVNTVTFNGGNGNAATRILTFASTSAASPHVLRFNGAQHVYFRNITINSTNVNDAWNVNFINSKRCGISNCIVSNANYSPNNTSFNVHGVLLNGSTTSYSTNSSSNDSIYIDSNAISTGIYNLSSFHNDGSKTIFIRGNTLTQAPYSCIYIQGNQTVKILGNTMTIRIGGSAYVFYNLYIASANPSGSNFHEISNNIFRESYNGAMQITSSSGNASVSGLIANNMISNFYYNSSQNFGIYTTSSNYWKIYHNSVNYALASNANASYCYFNSFGSNIDARNNIFAVTSSSAANCIPFYTSSNTAFITNNIDYNNYFNAAGTTLVNLAGTLYTSSNYKAAFTNPTGGGAGANSFNFNPQFVSATDLHRSSICYNGANLGITSDIDNQARPSSPDIGADEVVGNANDLSIDAIVSPTSSSVSAGPINITVLLRNVGTNAVTSGNLTYVLNGGSPVVIAIPSTINTCDTLSMTLTGLTMVSGTNTFVAFTSQPNGTTDANFSNDTIKQNYCTPMSGTFTVGGASPDYANFTAAVAALNCGGINGPVVFNVRGGTYNESIQINSIPGSSPTNTVIFQSDNGIASSVTLQNNVSGSFVVKLLDADNISFRNMTITSNLSGINAVQIIASADSCVNVTLYGNTLSTQWGVFASSNAAILATGKNPNLTIRRNSISRAAYGIYVQGNATLAQYNQNTVVDSNSITTAGGDAFQGMYFRYCSAPKVKYNNIQKNGCCADRGVEMNNISNGGEFSYNKLITTGGFNFGLLLQTINTNGETTPLMVFNNFISSNSGTYNFYVVSSNYINFFNNSLYINSGIYNMYANSSGTNSNINIVNNSFKSPSGLTSLFVGGTNVTTARAMIGECNYNNYYQGSGSAGENLLNLQGTNYTISTIKGAIKASSPMSDSNSNAFNPQYKSNTDLHILPSSGLDGRGKLLSAFFTDDIDGVKRLTNSFDIGADDTAVIRTTAGDYVAAGSCINISGTSWIDVTDTFGKLVFSINPEGNNLGPTCWGLRLNTAGLRKDSIMNSTDGFKYLSYFLDRNLYINPTTQPAAGTQVSLRFYCKQSEWQLLADTALTFGVTLNQYYMKMHRFHEPAATSTLVPLTTPTVNDSSHFLYVMAVNNYGVDKYLQYRTNHFSQFNPVFIPNVIPAFLPVTWLSFDAKANGNDANLDWATASERNSKDFDIERSVDGKEFTSVGKVRAAGNSSVIRTYSFIDKDAASLNADKVYYRLKQNDLDGQFEYSKIRVVQFKGKDGIIVHSVSPNPFNTNVSADFTLLSEDRVSLILTNISGQVVKIEQMQGQKGDNNYSMNTEELAAGVYFLKIQTKDNQLVYKLIKN